MNRAKQSTTQLATKLFAVLTICCVCVQASADWKVVLGSQSLGNLLPKSSRNCYVRRWTWTRCPMPRKPARASSMHTSSLTDHSIAIVPDKSMNFLAADANLDGDGIPGWGPHLD